MEKSTDQFPTRDKWCLYAHMPCDPGTYGKSYLRATRVDSFEGFARMWNHTHPELIGDPKRVVCIHKRPITGWSFFLDAVTPEWEHPRNRKGKTYSCRASFAPADLTQVWQALLMACVLGTQPSELVGIHVTRKYAGDGTLRTKVDVWADRSSTTLPGWLQRTTRVTFTEALRRM